ncbi:hypothetical protein SRB5_61700 [Streptomyces sp. RB5]|uniref:ATP/GTP-binding protein n=1 Tax=Streptomyces smaragdinus TaxID=2585196 RepID=A0A7K0CR64_9ACTN|nr:hypothetical protein [Streptomyces smaragdinus]MQY15978.1 hypothetical protein [Streptomyces smaragdinus]
MATDGGHQAHPRQTAYDGGRVPGQRGSFTAWLRAPRPEALPGIWRLGHVARAAEEPAGPDRRQLFGGAVLVLFGALIVWSLYRNDVFPVGVLDAPLRWITPDSWWESDGGPGHEAPAQAFAARFLYDILVLIGIGWVAARAGQWQEAVRVLLEPRTVRERALLTAAGGFCAWLLVWTGTVPVIGPVLDIVPSSWPRGGGNEFLAVVFVYGLYALVTLAVLWPFARAGHWRTALRGARRPTPAERAEPVPEPVDDPAAWPELRAAGLADVAARLSTDAASGAMNDVDHSRLTRAWEGVWAQPSRMRAFADAVTYGGAAACPHPSGLRDLPARHFRHDLTTGQVRIGAAPDETRTPWAYRGAGIALEPAVLGTGLVVVGPAASGKTGRVIAPVVETLCLQALAGRAAVVAVGAQGAPLGADEAYDVVIRPGDRESLHDLDFYGGTNDPDEAAALLAEAVLGGEGGAPDLAQVRQATTALAQLLGAYEAAHGAFPSVPELRALLDHDPAAVDALRAVADPAAARELDARLRQAGRPGDVGPLLADRLAVLDRPAFARFFDPADRGRQFSVRALEHPIRVRIDLPERAHAEASRLLARLILAQFTAAVPVRTDRSLFAALVLDDAAGAITPGAIRGVQRLRTANAGAVLGLRSLDEVPEQLRGALLAAMGCRMALSGVSTWDGGLFAQAWGAEWVETRDVTHAPDTSGGTLRRGLRGVRKAVTGTAATTESVTVRRVERARWSASDLANALPPGHGVLSVTTVEGERTPPVLVRLGQ